MTTAVWVGYPNKLVPMTTDYNGAPVEGGTYPAIIWHNFMVQALQIWASENPHQKITSSTDDRHDQRAVERAERIGHESRARRRPRRRRRGTGGGTTGGATGHGGGTTGTGGGAHRRRGGGTTGGGGGTAGGGRRRHAGRHDRRRRWRRRRHGGADRRAAVAAAADAAVAARGGGGGGSGSAAPASAAASSLPRLQRAVGARPAGPGRDRNRLPTAREAPRQLDGLRDADPPARRRLGRPASPRPGGDHDRPADQVGAVEVEPDAERLRELARAPSTGRRTARGRGARASTRSPRPARARGSAPPRRRPRARRPRSGTRGSRTSGRGRRARAARTASRCAAVRPT